ncbi:hypothetical protein AB0478_40015 [Streptomyces sp. NPDC051917]|uniref:hypothetical protein n=1 Tax=Streptomyces sp. NPDC051917 TaxID=3154754 RepID=UPI0034557684
MHDIASGHRVLIVGHPGVHGMELLGVRDMFEMASHPGGACGGPPAYEVEICSLDGTPSTWGGD